MAGEDEDVTIDLELRDALSANAKVAAHEADALADNLRQVNRQLLMLDRRSTKAATSLLQLDAAMRKLNGHQHPAITGFDTLTKQVATYTGENRKLSAALQAVDREARKENRSLRSSTRHLRLLTRAGRPAAAALMLVAAAMAAMAVTGAAGVAVQGLLQVGAALTSLISFAALVPTALGVLILTVVTLTTAFKGMGEAFSAAFSGDPAQLDAALKKLPPHARAFVKEFVPFVAQLKQMKALIQDALFKPLVKEVAPTLALFIPMLSAGLASLARSFGELFAAFARFLRTTDGLKIVATLLSNTLSLVKMLTDTLQPLGKGFADLIVSAAPYWDRFMGAIADGLTRFGQWLSQISGDGRLERWLNLAITTAGQLFDILVLVGDILTNIATAAGGAQGGAMVAIVAFLAEINAFTSSTHGQQAVAAFFDAFSRSLTTLAPLLSVVAGAIGNVLMPSVAAIVTALTPGLTVILEALSDGLAALIPYWGPFAAAVGALLAALSPLLPVLGELVGVLGMSLAQVFALLAGVLGPFVEAIAKPLMAIFQALAQQMVREMPLIAALAEVFADALAGLGPAMTQIAAIFDQEFARFLAEHAKLMAQNVPLLVQLATAYGQYLVNAVSALLPYLPGLLRAFFDLALTMAQLGPTLMPLIIKFFQDIYPQIIPLLPVLIQVATLLLQVAAVSAAAGLAIVGFAVKAAIWIYDLVNKIRGWFVGLFDILTAPFRLARDAILRFIADIAGSIGGLVGKVQGLLDKIKGIDINPFRALGGPVEAGQPYTVGEIGQEMYLPKIGNPQMVGTSGMETRTFPTAGVVVPSFMLDHLKRVENGMARQLDRVNSAAGSSRADAEQVAAAVRAAGERPSSDAYHVTINFNGGGPREIDVEHAVHRAIRKIEQDRKERA